MSTTTTRESLPSNVEVEPPPPPQQQQQNHKNHPAPTQLNMLEDPNNNNSGCPPVTRKKQRWSRAERRERADERHSIAQNHQQQQQPHFSQGQHRDMSTTCTRKQQRQTIFTCTEQLLNCATTKANHTESVVVVTPQSWHQQQQQAQSHCQYERYHHATPSATTTTTATMERSVRIVTSCDLPHPPTTFSSHGREFNGRDGAFHPQSTTILIYIKPLLVLDLNGILCHRVRVSREPPLEPHEQYRSSRKMIANTPVIPRTDVVPFCSFLLQHFTLAIWTSAQRKTALQLVQLLLPPHVQERLLFIWAQGQCDRVVPTTENTPSMTTYYPPSPSQPSPPQQPSPQPSSLSSTSFQHKPDPSKILYLKDLSKVWKEFPLWNASNTLLMDDSPDKCPFFRHNALHPPPIHGRELIVPQQQVNWSNDDYDGNRRRTRYSHSPGEAGNYGYGTRSGGHDGDVGEGGWGNDRNNRRGGGFWQDDNSIERNYNNPHRDQQYGHQGFHHYHHHNDGTNHHHHSSNNNNNINGPNYAMSDEENQRRQWDFFHRLVQFWRDYPSTNIIWDHELGGMEEATASGGPHHQQQPLPDPTRQRNESLLRFLNDYGVGHMGWMIPIHDCEEKEYNLVPPTTITSRPTMIQLGEDDDDYDDMCRICEKLRQNNNLC